MRHIYDDYHDYPQGGTIIILIILVIVLLFATKACQSGSIQDDFSRATYVVIEGETYNTDDIVDVYSNGEIYDTTYTAVLKDGTKIKFKTYTLKYDK